MRVCTKSNNQCENSLLKKAGIDRRHFSKIRSNPDYRPRKNTTIALALALELNTDETDDSVGYSLSDSETGDLVVPFCLEKKYVVATLDYFNVKL